MAVKKLQKPAHVVSRIKRVGHNRNKIEAVSSNNTSKKIPKIKKALIVAHEIKFAKLLAGNDKKVRDKVLRNLKKWLTLRSQSAFVFTEHDFMRLWKGLYYCMWMSDKPLIQEELAESLGNLVHCFTSMDTALLYTKCTLITLATEWFGLDQYRIDKFQMLVRRVVRQSFVACKNHSWDKKWVQGFAKIIQDLLSDSKTTLGFGMHLTELYTEELSKVAASEIPTDIVVEFIRPFAVRLAEMDDISEIRHVTKHIFRYLIFQSDVGLDYAEKFEAWRHAGFPSGTIDAMQKVQVDEIEGDSSGEETETDTECDPSPTEKPLDPRAGRVDVELPQLPLDAKAVADLVLTYRFHPSSTTKSRKQIVRLAKEFSEISEGKMPIGVKEIKLRDGSKSETDSKRAALRLLQFERELYADTVRRKGKKKRKQSLRDDADSPDEATSSKQGRKDNESERIKKKTLDSVVNAEKSDKRLKTNNQGKRKLASADTASDESTKSVTKARKVTNEAHFVENPKTKTRKRGKKNSTAMNGDRSNNRIKAGKRENNPDVNSLGNESFARSVKLTGTKKIVDSNWDVSENSDPPTPTAPIPQKSAETESKLFETKSENVKVSPTTPIPRKPANFSGIARVEMNSRWSTPMRRRDLIQEMELKTTNDRRVETIRRTSSVSPKKRVKIVLQRNTAQHTSEYARQLRQSPAIPYDANRKPLVGVLKPSPLPSPVNPFYKAKV